MAARKITRRSGRLHAIDDPPLLHARRLHWREERVGGSRVAGPQVAARLLQRAAPLAKA